MNGRKRCQSCWHFDGDTCRRFQPQLVSAPRRYPDLPPQIFNLETRFPYVQPTDWCGEHKYRDPGTLDKLARP